MNYDQPPHDMIIGNNFHRLYFPCTQTINLIIFTINYHLIPIDKSNKAYNTLEDWVYTQPAWWEDNPCTMWDITNNLTT